MKKADRCSRALLRGAQSLLSKGRSVAFLVSIPYDFVAGIDC